MLLPLHPGPPQTHTHSHTLQFILRLLQQLQLTMRSSLRWFCVGVVLLALAPPPAASFSRGANRASCGRMVPGHIRAHPQEAQHSHVSVRTSASSYVPGQLVTVTVRSSRDFMGFLLQARGAKGENRSLVGGSWALTPPGVHTLHCRSEGDTVTHSDKQLKRNLSFVWRAPDVPMGDVRFYITVVQSYFVYWANIESAALLDGSRGSRSVMRAAGTRLVPLGGPTPLADHLAPTPGPPTRPGRRPPSGGAGDTKRPPPINTLSTTSPMDSVQISTGPAALKGGAADDPNTSLETQTLPRNPEPNEDTTSPESTRTSFPSSSPSMNPKVPPRPTSPHLKVLIQELSGLVLTSRPVSPTQPPGHWPHPEGSVPQPSADAPLPRTGQAQTETPPQPGLVSSTGPPSSPPSISLRSVPVSSLVPLTSPPDLSLRSAGFGRSPLPSTKNQPETAAARPTLPSPSPMSSPPHSLSVHPSTTSPPPPAPPSSTPSRSMTPPITSPHPGPSPAPRRSLDVPVMSSSSPVTPWKPTAIPDAKPKLLPPSGTVVHPNPKPHPNLHLHPEPKPVVPNVEVQPKPPSGAPDLVPRHSDWELGMLLGCSAGLGMALVVALRYVYRQACGRQTAVTLNHRETEYGRGERGLIHVQECGDLVRVRKIRENSFVLLAEYDILAPPGD